MQPMQRRPRIKAGASSKQLRLADDDAFGIMFLKWNRFDRRTPRLRVPVCLLVEKGRNPMNALRTKFSKVACLACCAVALLVGSACSQNTCGDCSSDKCCMAKCAAGCCDANCKSETCCKEKKCAANCDAPCCKKA